MANVVDTVAIKMVVDASGVKDGIGATTKEITEATRIVNSMRTPLERLEEKERRLQELFAKGAVDDIPKYERALQAITDAKDKLTAANQTQVASEGQVVISQEKVIKNLSVLGDMVKFHIIQRGVQMVTSGFHQMVAGITEAQKRLDEIGDTAARLGADAAGLQALRIQADLSDVSFESLTGGMEKLMIRSADAAMGNKDLQQTFGMLGISMADLNAMTDAERFNAVTQALSNVSDRAQRLSIIADLFGKGNTEMIMFIDNMKSMSDIAERANAIVSNEDMEMIGMVDQSMKELKLTVEGIFNQAAVALAPGLNEALNTISEFLQDRSNIEGFIEGIRMIGNEMAGLAQFAVDLKQMFDDIVDSLTDVNTEGGAALADFREEQRLRSEARRGAATTSRFLELKQELKDEGISTRGASTVEELLKLKREHQQASRQTIEISNGVEESFDKESQALKDQITLLTQGKEAIDQQKDARAGYSNEQQDYLAGLREEKAALEAIKFAEQEDVKLKKERMSEAERIRQSLQTAEEAAADRLARAMDLVTLGEAGGLTQDEFDKLLEKEARGLDRGKGEFRLSASGFGSQAAIAATLGRAQGSDSDRLESIKNSLLELVRKPAVEVEEVGAI